MADLSARLPAEDAWETYEFVLCEDPYGEDAAEGAEDIAEREDALECIGEVEDVEGVAEAEEEALEDSADVMEGVVEDVEGSAALVEGSEDLAGGLEQAGGNDGGVEEQEGLDVFSDGDEEMEGDLENGEGVEEEWEEEPEGGDAEMETADAEGEGDARCEQRGIEDDDDDDDGSDRSRSKSRSRSRSKSRSRSRSSSSSSARSGESRHSGSQGESQLEAPENSTSEAAQQASANQAAQAQNLFDSTRWREVPASSFPTNLLSELDPFPTLTQYLAVKHKSWQKRPGAKRYFDFAADADTHADLGLLSARAASAICTLCLEENHQARTCPQRRCFSCFKPGHESYQCADQGASRRRLDETLKSPFELFPNDYPKDFPKDSSKDFSKDPSKDFAKDLSDSPQDGSSARKRTAEEAGLGSEKEIATLRCTACGKSGVRHLNCTVPPAEAFVYRAFQPPQGFQNEAKRWCRASSYPQYSYPQEPQYLGVNAQNSVYDNVLNNLLDDAARLKHSSQLLTHKNGNSNSKDDDDDNDRLAQWTLPAEASEDGKSPQVPLELKTLRFLTDVAMLAREDSNPDLRTRCRNAAKELKKSGASAVSAARELHRLGLFETKHMASSPLEAYPEVSSLGTWLSELEVAPHIALPLLSASRLGLLLPMAVLMVLLEHSPPDLALLDDKLASPRSSGHFALISTFFRWREGRAVGRNDRFGTGLFWEAIDDSVVALCKHTQESIGYDGDDAFFDELDGDLMDVRRDDGRPWTLIASLGGKANAPRWCRFTAALAAAWPPQYGPCRDGKGWVISAGWPDGPVMETVVKSAHALLFATPAPKIIQEDPLLVEVAGVQGRLSSKDVFDEAMALRRLLQSRLTGDIGSIVEFGDTSLRGTLGRMMDDSEIERILNFLKTADNEMQDQVQITSESLEGTSRNVDETDFSKMLDCCSQLEEHVDAQPVGQETFSTGVAAEDEDEEEEEVEEEEESVHFKSWSTALAASAALEALHAVECNPTNGKKKCSSKNTLTAKEKQCISFAREALQKRVERLRTTAREEEASFRESTKTLHELRKEQAVEFEDFALAAKLKKTLEKLEERSDGAELKPLALETLLKEKSQAVEDEDFEKAAALKAQQQQLEASVSAFDRRAKLRATDLFAKRVMWGPKILDAITDMTMSTPGQEASSQKKQSPSLRIASDAVARLFDDVDLDEGYWTPAYQYLSSE